jgi:hypothetical protein
MVPKSLRTCTAAGAEVLIYWASRRHLNQWWIDAFTIDPHAMLLHYAIATRACAEMRWRRPWPTLASAACRR